LCARGTCSFQTAGIGNSQMTMSQTTLHAAVVKYGATWSDNFRLRSSDSS
jgi:hypothetical protein